MIEPALASLEALGPALEEHLQLLLPALVRLICPGAYPKTLLFDGFFQVSIVWTSDLVLGKRQQVLDQLICSGAQTN